jgi:hypothetical protein
MREKQTRRDESFLQFTSDFRTTLGKYAGLLADLRPFQGNESSEEVLKWKKMVAGKEAELISMRNMYISARQSSHSPIEKLLIPIESAATLLSEQQRKLTADISQALCLFKGYLETCTQKLPEITANIPAILAEINALRVENDKEKAEIRRLEMELEQAQGIIAVLMETVGHYESVDGADSRADIRAEALEKELAELRNVKMAREKTLMLEIEGIRGETQAKNVELEEIRFEMAKCRALASSSPSDSVKSLQNTINSACTLAEQLQFQLTELQTSANSPTSLLSSEELQILSKEMQKSEEIYLKLTTTWEQNQSFLREEASSLQKKINSLEENQVKLQKVLSEQHSLLSLQTQQLQQLKESTVQSLNLAIPSADGSREDTYEALKGEAQAVREEMQTLVRSHSVQIEELKRFYESEIRNKKGAENAVAQEGHLQVANLKQLAMTLTTEREKHQVEIAHIREEAKRLRNHYVERYELLQRERNLVLAELQALMTFVGKQEEQDCRSAYDGIRKVKELLDTVKGDRRQFDKIQQIREELKALKERVGERSNAHVAESTALKEHLTKLKDSYEALATAVAAEREDHQLELNITESRIQSLEKEGNLLRQQRDDALLLNRL